MIKLILFIQDNPAGLPPDDATGYERFEREREGEVGILEELGRLEELEDKFRRLEELEQLEELDDKLDDLKNLKTESRSRCRCPTNLGHRPNLASVWCHRIQCSRVPRNAGITGVPRSFEIATSQDPTVGLCLGPSSGPRAGCCFL